MGSESKMYRKYSCDNTNPVVPSAYSSSRRIDRIRIKALARYRARMCFFQGTSEEVERAVGFLLVRRWKTMATMRKKTKKMTWTKRPPVITFCPLLTDDSVLLAVMPAPNSGVRRALDIGVDGMLTQSLHDEG